MLGPSLQSSLSAFSSRRSIERWCETGRTHGGYGRFALPQSCLIHRKSDGGEGGQDVAGVAEGLLEHGRSSFL
jgi:hypothetical protein